tara:strand:+ start:6184 stop:8760 length:2577 start_codon:yes stop_codon:yes gene_type:complete
MSMFTLLADLLFVGHSLIGPSLPAMVSAGLAQQGVNMTVAAQIINGAPLRYAWDNSAEGEGVDARIALPEGQTRVLVLTEAIPLAAQVEWNDSAGQVAKFAGLAWQARPDTQVYIYETWHSLNSGPGAVIAGDPGAGVPWRERIDADLPLWEGLTVQANAQRPAGAPLVRLIPAGQAMARLSDAIARGEVPGISAIRALFDDDIHPDDKALYFLALVHIATISGQSPVGLPAKLTRRWISREAVITDAQAAAFQRIAWDAVQTYRADDAARIAALVQGGTSQEKAGVRDTAKGLTDKTIAPATVPEAQPLPATINRFATVTNPRLSLGLAPVNDWSVQQPFLDVMKTARPWFGHLPGRWGGYEFGTLKAGGFLDADGWPRRIPPDVTALSTLVLTDLPENAGAVAGRYVLRYQGKGTLRVEGRARVSDTQPGRIVFDYTPGPGSVVLTLSSTSAGDPIRNISIVRDSREGALAAGALFNPDWLNRIRGVRGLRFMDWMATNNSTISAAADRPGVSDFSWAVKGVPVEVMVALANELRADPWFTLPHLATDEFARLYADTVRDTLAPGLRAQIEFSNEVWNWQFDQARWADSQCRARWQVKDCWVQFYALRAAEVADIWADSFGADAKDRLVRVVATQTGWPGLEDQILNSPLVRAEGHRPPGESFDAYAVTGYFAAGLGSAAKADILDDWLRKSAEKANTDAEKQGLTGKSRQDYTFAHRFDLATELASDELESGAISGSPEDSLDALLTKTLPYHARVAKAWGLRLMMYEGGTHVVGLGPRVENATLAAFFQQLNYSPRMGLLYEKLLTGWAALTDAPFNAFVDVATPVKWGSWGALRHLGDDNPRWRALAQGCRTC